MSRAISQTILVIVLLILFSGLSDAQTWRLTDNPTSDSLPKVEIDGSGRVLVSWLSNGPGNFDVYCRRFDNGFWSDTLRLHTDSINQRCIARTYDRLNDRIWIGWDSSGIIQAAYYQGDSVIGILDVNDSLHSLTSSMPMPFRDAPFFMIADDTGKVYFVWASLCSLTLNSVLLRSYNGSYSNIETIAQGFDGIGITEDHSPRSLCIQNNNKPYIFLSTFFDDMAGWNWQANGIYHWNADSCKWDETLVIRSNPSSYTFMPIALSSGNGGKIYAFYIVDEPTQQWSILCKSFTTSNFQYDSCQVISDYVSMPSGASDDRHIGIFVWSNDGKIFLSYLKDSLWSNPPFQISDTLLLGCINPDVVTENDSIAWICYQSDGDIYVTRTTIPTGIAGQPEQIAKKQPISLAAFPNPSRGKFRFERHGSISSNNTISIYDIAGRRVRLLETDAWDGRDEGGERAAPGVYFARLESGGEKTTTKLTIIK